MIPISSTRLLCFLSGMIVAVTLVPPVTVAAARRSGLRQGGLQRTLGRLS